MSDLLKRIAELRANPDFELISETDEWYEAVENRRAEQLSEMPVPFCCPTIAGARAVFPAGDGWDYKDPPEWQLNYSTPTYGYMPLKANACPFCATKLPSLVLKKNPPKQVCQSDGNYCLTCRERLNSCLCSHPYSIYEVEGTLPDFAVAALITLPAQGRRGWKFLSVSRKDNPLDKGMPGGKIDPGETPREALVRELFEETGLKALDFHPIFDAQDTTAKRCVTYHVTKYEGELATSEAGVIEWVEKQGLIREGSTFEAYNKALFYLLDPQNRYG